MQGRPVYIQQLGHANIEQLFAAVTEDQLLKWHIQEYERLTRVILPACSAVSSQPVETSFSLLDLRGIKFRCVVAAPSSSGVLGCIMYSH